MVNGIIYDTMEIMASRAYIGPRNYFYVDIEWTAQDGDGLYYQDTLSMWYDDSQEIWRRSESDLPDEISAAVVSLWLQGIDKSVDIRR